MSAACLTEVFAGAAEQLQQDALEKRQQDTNEFNVLMALYFQGNNSITGIKIIKINRENDV